MALAYLSPHDCHVGISDDRELKIITVSQTSAYYVLTIFHSNLLVGSELTREQAHDGQT
jgi:hypothetical protein